MYEMCIYTYNMPHAEYDLSVNDELHVQLWLHKIILPNDIVA